MNIENMIDLKDIDFINSLKWFCIRLIDGSIKDEKILNLKKDEVIAVYKDKFYECPKEIDEFVKLDIKTIKENEIKNIFECNNEFEEKPKYAFIIKGVDEIYIIQNEDDYKNKNKCVFTYEKIGELNKQLRDENFDKIYEKEHKQWDEERKALHFLKDLFGVQDNHYHLDIDGILEDYFDLLEIKSIKSEEFTELLQDFSDDIEKLTRVKKEIDKLLKDKK